MRRSLLVLLAFLLVPGAALAAPGELDTRFGTEGSAQYAVDGYGGTGFSRTTAIPQDDGGALLIGTAMGPEIVEGSGGSLRVAVMRVDASGAVDASFGGPKWLPPEVGYDAVEAVELPDGDVVVLSNGATKGEGGAYALTRLNTDGTVDTSFGTDGVTLTGFNDFSSDDCPDPPNAGCGAAGGALTLHGTDHLVVGAQHAWSTQYSYGGSPALARYDLDGDLDIGFGSGDGVPGTLTLALPAGHSNPAVYDVAIEPGPEAKILLTHESLLAGAQHTWAHRVDADGAPDNAFGTGGRVEVRFDDDPDYEGTISERAHAIASVPGGDIFIAGEVTRFPATGITQHYGAVARLDPEGDPVTTFGTDGVVITRRAQGNNGFQQLKLIDGLLYAGGSHVPYDDLGQRSDTDRAWLARIDEDGLDGTFGQDGTVLGGPMTWMTSLLDAGDGFALTTGDYGYSDHVWAAVRFDLADERQPVNTAAPEVDADGASAIQAGTEVTAVDGTWHYGTLSRQWQRCPAARTSEEPPAAGCTDIAGATEATYTAQTTDEAQFLRVVVTGTSGSRTTSVASATIEVWERAPAFGADPQVTPSGSVPAGTTVRATWTATGTEPIDATVTWYRCPGATQSGCTIIASDDNDDDSYVTTATDVGKYVRAFVYLQGPGGMDARDTANATEVTAAGSAVAPAATSAPAITPTGSAVEGTALRVASNGGWDQDGLTFTYRWERCDGACAAIPGAGGESYTSTAADVGKSVRVRVDARKGTGPIGTAVSPATDVTAKPVPPPAPPAPPAAPAPPKQAPNPFGLRGTVVTQDTTNTKPMPDVRGLQIDAAKQKIEAAGIFAEVETSEAIRAKPLALPGKPRLDIGDVSAQSIAAGTPVMSGIGQRKAIRLVTEAGPKATKANGGPSGPVCTGAAARDDLKKLGLGEVLDLLKAKGCTRVEVDFTVSSSAREVEVRRATKDGKDLLLQVTVPKDPKAMDLTAIFRQGAFNGRPSFGRDDWALTAGTMNIMGVQVVNRAGITIENAEVYVDARNVGADDIDDRARGAFFVRGFRPTKQGVVNVLVVQRDAAGNRIFGFGRFRVDDRDKPFTAIDGKRYTADGSPAGSGARAASIGDFFAAIGRLAQDLGANVARMFSGGATEQTISTAAKQNVGMVQLSLGDILSGKAGVVSAGGGNVVAAGGANVVSAGGGNVVSAGGGNVVSAGGGNVVSAGGGNVVSAGGGNMLSLAAAQVVSAGGGNLIGRDSIKNGSGALIALPAGVISAGGGNLISDNGLGVVAAGGGNMIGMRP